MADKVIVSNRGALKDKYGAAGLKKVEAAVKRLVAADKTRGIVTKLVYLDDATAMNKLGAAAVTDATDPRQNKVAIDGVYAGLDAPDYVMILGSIDVVPHQDLKNPLFSPDPDEDNDQFAFGDLPYATDKPYSQRPEDFLTVTRVVGRLPDLTGGDDPAYLVGLLDTAAKYKQRDRAEYAKYLGVSADVWKVSTAMSLRNVFGAGASDLQTSPKSGPNWGARLPRLSHFFNCHGNTLDPTFVGQDANDDYPLAHESKRVVGKVSEGVVCAAECCYGAELYNPALAGGEMPICNAYMGSKCYGYLGSSTIAYGPAEDNGSADLICQFFLRKVVDGASIGRAALEARQQFIQGENVMGPFALKTIAQFNLIGDPSIHPVSAPAPHGGGAAAGARRRGGRKSAPAAALEAGGAGAGGVENRRLRLANFGAAIGAAANAISSDAKTTASDAVKRMLRDALGGGGRRPTMGGRRGGRPSAAKAALPSIAGLSLDDMTVMTFPVRTPPRPPAAVGLTRRKFAAIAPQAIHVAMASKKPKNAPRPQLTAVVAVEQNNAIRTVRVLVSR